MNMAATIAGSNPLMLPPGGVVCLYTCYPSTSAERSSDRVPQIWVPKKADLLHRSGQWDAQPMPWPSRLNELCLPVPTGRREAAVRLASGRRHPRGAMGGPAWPNQ